MTKMAASQQCSVN